MSSNGEIAQLSYSFTIKNALQDGLYPQFFQFAILSESSEIRRSVTTYNRVRISRKFSVVSDKFESAARIESDLRFPRSVVLSIAGAA